MKVNPKYDLITPFDSPAGALEELSFLVEETSKPHAITHMRLGRQFRNYYVLPLDEAPRHKIVATLFPDEGVAA